MRQFLIRGLQQINSAPAIGQCLIERVELILVAARFVRMRSLHQCFDSGNHGRFLRSVHRLLEKAVVPKEKSAVCFAGGSQNASYLKQQGIALNLAR